MSDNGVVRSTGSNHGDDRDAHSDRDEPMKGGELRTPADRAVRRGRNDSFMRRVNSGRALVTSKTPRKC